MGLQLVVDNTLRREDHRSPSFPTSPYFDGLLERTRGQLREDLKYYQGRLRDLGVSDAHSLGELKALYRSREQYILRLLRTMGDRPQAI